MKIALLYLANLIPLSIILAIFEIWLEGFKKGPWGKTEFDHVYWGRKITVKGFFSRFIIKTILKRTYVTPYHVWMYLVIIPGVSLVNYFVLWVLAGSTWPLKSWLFLSVMGTGIFIPLFIPAIWLGNMVLEDFLWFAIQSWTGWREPEALPRLLRGEFKWHTDWFKIGGIKLPSSYLTGTLSTILFLIIQYVVVLWFG